MRRSVLIALFALFGLLAGMAGGEEQIVVAAAGECAGEERELVVPFLPKSAGDDAMPPAQLLLSPLNVAASASFPSASPPELPAFAGPGACDNPGSGCLPDKIIEDPDPGTGCGFPGSPCP